MPKAGGRELRAPRGPRRQLRRVHLAPRRQRATCSYVNADDKMRLYFNDIFAR